MAKASIVHGHELQDLFRHVHCCHTMQSCMQLVQCDSNAYALRWLLTTAGLE